VGEGERKAMCVNSIACPLLAEQESLSQISDRPTSPCRSIDILHTAEDAAELQRQCM